MGGKKLPGDAGYIDTWGVDGQTITFRIINFL
jgi:hypothetical protein